MNQRSFSLLADIIFAIIALLYLLRTIYGWDPVVEGRRVQMDELGSFGRR